MNMCCTLDSCAITALVEFYSCYTTYHEYTVADPCLRLVRVGLAFAEKPDTDKNTENILVVGVVTVWSGSSNFPLIRRS